MGTAMLIMFLLSFPLNLLALPVMLILEFGFGIRSYGIERSYIYLVIYFALGFVQWFWLVPRLFQKSRFKLQTLKLNTQKPAAALGEAHISPDFSFFDSESKTPVERVIDDYSEKL